MAHEPVASRSAQFSELDFDRLCWHDCHIWGIAFRVDEPSKGDWTSELVLDIDFICEWCCNNAEGRFRVAPAKLVFHGVESLAIAIRHVESSLAYPLSIAEITCATNKGSTPQWRIALNWPEGGEITFAAAGFKQTLLADPLLVDEQCLPLGVRESVLSR